MRSKIVLLAALAVMVASSAFGSTLSDAVRVWPGVQGAWFDGGEATAFPNDFEAGGVVSASLSPHISIVGSTFYGFSEEYLRYAIGPRITVTDVENKDFSIGLGISWNGSGADFLGEPEWCPDASVGWVPLPAKMPKVVLVGQGSYGLDSNTSRVTLGVRYKLNLP